MGITELKHRAPSCQGQDPHVWLYPTEEVGGTKSATATRIFALLSRVARRTATPEPIERQVNMKLAREHLT
jgi:hypothetical protein